MTECPCRDCKERVLGCHSICLRYAEWSRKNEEERERLYKQKYLKTIGRNNRRPVRIRKK